MHGNTLKGGYLEDLAKWWEKMKSYSPMYVRWNGTT